MKFDAIIVGAGPAGIGCAFALKKAGIVKVLLLEAEEVGATFRRWPEEMRLITPSFHGNPFFQTDLNAVTPDTSPADFYQKEHLSGKQYANYLHAVTKHFKLKVHENEKVLQVEPQPDEFIVQTNQTTYRTRVGIYYSGPSLVQRNSKFCFIYKFRARFGVIARSVARRLGYPEPDLEDLRRRGFLIDDLECCTNCECAVESKAESVGSNR